MVQHCARSFKIGDNTVNERGDHRNVSRLTTLHLVRFIPDGNYFTSDLVDGNDGWLINNYTPASHCDYRTGGPHVDRHGIRDEISQCTQTYQRSCLGDDGHKKPKGEQIRTITTVRTCSP